MNVAECPQFQLYWQETSNSKGPESKPESKSKESVTVVFIEKPNERKLTARSSSKVVGFLSDANYLKG